MAIKASSAKYIDSLIADLTGAQAVKRDSAVARLTVIGARAVDRLLAVAGSRGDAGVRIAALRALEGIADERALPLALQLAGDADPAAAPVAVAAIAIVRLFLRGPKGAKAVDRLTTIALDAGHPAVVRASAVGALRDLGAKTIAPLLKTLAADPGVTVQNTARAGEPTEPGAVREWLGREGRRAPLPALLEIMESARDRETADSQWALTRAAAHLALARRGSRIGLYDVKESLEKSGTPLPVDTLAALALIGDGSCLEPIASACVKSKDVWWRDHLADAYRTIVKRERLTPRHAVMKKIAKRFPGFAI